MSVPSTRNVMSVYTVDNDAASTGTLAAGTDSGEMTRSLVKAVCDMDLDQLSDEAMNDLIKKTLRSVVCKPALALKNEIVQDMELEKMEKCLRNHIQRMKIYLNTFIETQKFETEQKSRDPEYSKVIERRKANTMENIALMMSEVKDIESRISASNSLWECFRENYKKEMATFLDKKIKEYEDGVSSVPVITWEDFLPKIASPDGECVMTYYA